MSHSAAIENQNIESSDIKKKKRKRLFSCLAVSIALAGAGSFAWWEFVGSRYVETDNAYTDVESAQLSSAVTGTVSAILVTDSQVVKKGDILIQLDPTDAQLALNQAEADLNLSIRRVNGYKATDTKLGAEVVANEKEQKRLLAQVDAANADFQRATVDLKRREALMQTGAISGDELTRIQNVYASALANLNAAKAAVAQADAAKQAAVGARQANAVLIENADTETNPEVVLARAKRDQARLDLERTVIRSPVDGVVARR
ncbi:TPA: HlyD family secretion protein [Enterobacter roggenkampii]